MNSEVKIVCAADERFAMPLAVTVRSAAAECSRPVRAFVIMEGRSDKTTRAVERVCAAPNAKPTIEWLEPDSEYLRDMPLGLSHLSRATFLRLAMGRLISPEVDRVIYIDSDVLVVGDLAELWDTPLDGNIVGAVPDMNTPLAHDMNALGFCCGELDLPHDHLLFNAGVLLIDLVAYRAQNIEQQCIDFMHRWKDQLCSADQGALNAVLCRRWKRLDYRWNVQIGGLSDYKESAHLLDSDREALNALKPSMLHFSGSTKPWNSGLRSPHCRRYVQSVGELGWHGRLGFKTLASQACGLLCPRGGSQPPGHLSSEQGSRATQTDWHDLMESRRPQIVVMTPVRNEAWILPRFLEVTGRVADRIIILDQNSTDGGAELCRRHPKVVFLENPSHEYDEAGRQRMLIDAARQAVPQPRVLLALDADEIIAADAMDSEDWRRGINAAPGTVLLIEKPTFYGSMDTVIRYPGGFPLGFVDDNAPHRPRFIHSVRVPAPPNASQLRLDGVKVLHYALLRTAAQEAKVRMYSVLENVRGTRHVLARRQVYRAGRDYSREGPLEPTPRKWIEGWEKLGIDMRTVPDDPPHWQDLEVLRLMAQFGARRLWLDDIWDVDWERMRQHAARRGIAAIPDTPIVSPPAFVRTLARIPDAGYLAFLGLRSVMQRLIGHLSSSGKQPPRTGKVRGAAPEAIPAGGA